MRKFHPLCLAIPLMFQFAHAAPYPAHAPTIAGYTQNRSSDHFQVFWKDTTAYSMDVAYADAGLKKLEAVYDKLVVQLGFAYFPHETTPTKANAYIITDGWAFGGGDGTGAGMWLARDAFGDPWALAHEYTHGLQVGSGGFRDNKYTGWTWENHANWMAHQMYPTEAHCSEAYTRMQELHYGSTRNRYCSWQFFEYLKDVSGSHAIVNNLWSTWPTSGTPSAADEDFFRALMRTQGWNQTKLNDTWGQFALRMAAYDFKNGAVYRKAWSENRPDEWTRKQWLQLDAIDSAKGRYAIPLYLAPQRLAQNVVRLYPDSGKDTMLVNFQGLAQASRPASWNARKPANEFEPDTVAQPNADWRWGLVAVNPTGNAGQPKFRYIGPFTGNTGDGTQGTGPAARLIKQSGESQFYLVVAATPTNRHLIMWDQMYYSLYRYPWMVQVRGGKPEGFQAGAWAPPAGVAGAKHANGGGFVASTAKVAATAFVGPHARVLGNAQVQGNARIAGNATVKENAVVKDNAVIQDRAVVRGNASIYGSAKIINDAVVTTGAVYEQGVVKEAASLIANGKLFGTAQLGGVSVTWDNGFAISGTAQILGDAEVRSITATKGVFYGFVDNAVVGNASMGATRTAPVPEVTTVPTWKWTNSEPKISFTTSATKATPSAPISLNASAVDLDGKVTSLQVLVNGTATETVAGSQLQSALKNLAVGNHTVQIKATDDDNASVLSAPIKLEILADVVLSIQTDRKWQNGIVASFALPSSASRATLQLLNHQGTILRSLPLFPKSSSVTLSDVQQLPSGVYTLRVISEKTTLVVHRLNKAQ